MTPTRSHLSITLPRNFTFHYTDEPPKTPEPQTSPEEITEPPPPPRQVYRVRRRRGALPNYKQDDWRPQASHDVPIPTIETSAVSEQSLQVPAMASEPQREGYLAPTPSISRPTSPPKTPIAQIATGMESSCHIRNEWEERDPQNQGDSIARPSSACSNFSDSSVASSRDSLDSFLSLGSCTSPDSDSADPFTYPKPSNTKPNRPSPLQSYRQRPSKRLKMRKDISWTEEMDHHLWLTYLKYLQDPTVTPFKMLPGTAPPLGVCHRVVREAKKTWKGVRNYLLNPRSPQSLGFPDTIRTTKSGSNTPTGCDGRKPHPKWPRSEAATRRRLRELCKRKPSLSAHYQRLMRTRTPSPFQSSPKSSPKPRSGDIFTPITGSNHQSSFSTREMNISLVTSTAASMQYGNPLSQLANSAPRPQHGEPLPQPFSRTHAHQKSQSLQLGLGLGGQQSDNDVRMLGSPFQPPPRRSNSLLEAAPSAENQPDHAPAPRLDSPLELHAPRPSLPRSFKRRAQHHLEEELSNGGMDLRTDLLQELFGDPAAFSHRRVRSRGFSLGDMGRDARRFPDLSTLFSPPDATEHGSSSESMGIITATSGLLAPPTDETRRLGSPFGGRSTNLHFHNTFPRNFCPSFQASTSFEERLGELGSGLNDLSKNSTQGN